MKTILKVMGACAILVAATVANATQLQILQYDMPNGGGQASGGQYNYWDAYGFEDGCFTCDGAPLSVYLGNLNDGQPAGGPWYATENSFGSGPYVGWLATGVNQLNPTITFHVSSPSVRLKVGIHIDNSQIGGVFAPSQVIFNGRAIDLTWLAVPPAGEAGWLYFYANNGTRKPTLQLVQEPGSWVFASEVTFNTVPEPASWALMIAGFGMVGAAVRRRKAVFAA